MTKAFDIVNRKILLNIINKYGLRGKIAEIIESYLTNRTQIVKVREAFSSPLPVETGVVQGSTLGSLLFILFFNGISVLNNLKGKLFLFADDAVLINSHSKKENIEQKVVMDMKIIMDFIERQGMLMNVKKTNFMIFHTINTACTNVQELKINDDHAIKRVYKYKYLGLIMDPNLKWNEHGAHIEKKLCHAAGILWKFKSILSTGVKKRVYFSLFQSHLNYMVQVWGVASDSVIKPLQVIQNRAVRNVFNIDRLENRINMYTHLVQNCLPIRALHYVSTATYVYSNIHKLIHTNLVIQKSNSRGRNAGRLSPATSRTNYGKKNIKSIGANIFNNIPNDVKTLKSAAAFKWSLKCQIRTEIFMSNCFSNNYLKNYGGNAQ